MGMGRAKSPKGQTGASHAKCRGLPAPKIGACSACTKSRDAVLCHYHARSSMRRAGHEPGELDRCRILLEPLVGHSKNLSLGLNVMGTPW